MMHINVCDYSKAFVVLCEKMDSHPFSKVVVHKLGLLGALKLAY